MSRASEIAKERNPERSPDGAWMRRSCGVKNVWNDPSPPTLVEREEFPKMTWSHYSNGFSVKERAPGETGEKFTVEVGLSPISYFGRTEVEAYHNTIASTATALDLSDLHANTAWEAFAAEVQSRFEGEGWSPSAASSMKDEFMSRVADRFYGSLMKKYETYPGVPAHEREEMIERIKGRK